MQEKPKLLYILAPSYSGSTLLTHLLASHPSISTIGELKATQMGEISQYICSCGQLIDECEFWRSMQARCEELGIAFSLDRFDTVISAPGFIESRLVRAAVRGRLFEGMRRLGISLMPGARRAIKDKVQRNHALSQVVCELQGGPIFLDGSKDSTRLMHFVDSGLWSPYVIYLQRDGRGVTNSISRYQNIPFEQAGAVWAWDVRELQRMRARLEGVPVLDLHYEDLCREPGRHIEEIYSWLGIESTGVNTQDVKAGGFHILGNNKMRTGSVHDVRLDEKWRTKLTEEQKISFMQRYGRAQKELGYV